MKFKHVKKINDGLKIMALGVALMQPMFADAQTNYSGSNGQGGGGGDAACYISNPQPCSGSNSTSSEIGGSLNSGESSQEPQWWNPFSWATVEANQNTSNTTSNPSGHIYDTCLKVTPGAGNTQECREQFCTGAVGERLKC